MQLSKTINAFYCMPYEYTKYVWINSVICALEYNVSVSIDTYSNNSYIVIIIIISISSNDCINDCLFGWVEWNSLLACYILLYSNLLPGVT